MVKRVLEEKDFSLEFARLEILLMLLEIGYKLFGPFSATLIPLIPETAHQKLEPLILILEGHILKFYLFLSLFTNSPGVITNHGLVFS